MKKSRANVNTAVVDEENFTACDAAGNRLPVKAKFPFRCIKCRGEYQASIVFERTKKHPWHCKACAISLEWADEAYRQRHVEELRKSNSTSIARARASAQSRANWADPAIRERMMARDHVAVTAKGRRTLCANLLSGKTTLKVTHGKRVLVGNTWMRSTYEARFANVLSSLNLAWEYEPRCFPVLEGKTYLPDFYIPSLDLYVEVKGWWRDDAREKFDAFVALHPTLKCALVGKQDLESLERKETTLEACVITQRG